MITSLHTKSLFKLSKTLRAPMILIIMIRSSTSLSCLELLHSQMCWQYKREKKSTVSQSKMWRNLWSSATNSATFWGITWTKMRSSPTCLEGLIRSPRLRVDPSKKSSTKRISLMRKRLRYNRSTRRFIDLLDSSQGLRDTMRDQICLTKTNSGSATLPHKFMWESSVSCPPSKARKSSP